MNYSTQTRGPPGRDASSALSRTPCPTDSAMFSLLTLVDWIIEAIQLLIILSSILSWFPGASRHALARGVHAVVDPILHPIRAILPGALGMDFSPLVAILILWFLQSLLHGSAHVPRLS